MPEDTKEFKIIFTGDEDGALCEVYKFWEEEEAIARDLSILDPDCENIATYRIEVKKKGRSSPNMDGVWWDFCEFHKNVIKNSKYVEPPLQTA